MFHFVFCRDGRGINGSDFAERCEETVAFDRFEFDPDVADSDAAWAVVDVIFDPQKRPIQFARHIGGECIPLVNAAIANLAERGFLSMADDLVSRLRETSQVFEIEFDEMFADDDVWEFLDIMETYFASERDGVIYTADEGFFDEDNRPLRAFQ